MLINGDVHIPCLKCNFFIYFYFYFWHQTIIIFCHNLTVSARNLHATSVKYIGQKLYKSHRLEQVDVHHSKMPIVSIVSKWRWHICYSVGTPCSSCAILSNICCQTKSINVCLLINICIVVFFFFVQLNCSCTLTACLFGHSKTKTKNWNKKRAILT